MPDVESNDVPAVIYQSGNGCQPNWQPFLYQ